MKTFSEEERIIAASIGAPWAWLARDEDGDLKLFVKKPEKSDGFWNEECILNGRGARLNGFRHMFQAIQWEDPAPVRIKHIYEPPKLTEGEAVMIDTMNRYYNVELVYKESGDCGLAIYLMDKNRDNVMVLRDCGDFLSGILAGEEISVAELGIE